MMNTKHAAVTEHYRAIVEAQGLSWAEYCDCDHWTLMMLFDESIEDDEDY